MAIIPNWILITLVVIIPTALLCLLQWWLSGRKSRFPGLILPALHLITTIVLLIAVSTYSFGATTVMDVTGMTGYEQIDDAALEQLQKASGDVQTTPPPVPATPDESTSIGIIGGADGPTAVFVASSPDPFSMLPLLLVLNVPTYLYLIIYVLQRRRLSHRQTVDKTRIQDM